MAFERNVFVNCPFDDDYAPLMQAILFCIVYLGFSPRIASERDDAGENRLAKIVELIRASQYSIHDISRCQAAAGGELYRLNMPFELGVDYGFRMHGGQFATKKFLILEEQEYRYQAALSDMSGSDIRTHKGSYQTAIRQVRNWLVNEAQAERVGAQRIISAYETDFQEWHYEKQLAAGYSDEDIIYAPTSELLAFMKEWIAEGKPVGLP